MLYKCFVFTGDQLMSPSQDNVGLLLGQRRRRWATTKPTLVTKGGHLVFAGPPTEQKNTSC